MGFKTLDSGAGGLIQSPLLDNPGSTNLMVVDWFGLSESNLTASAPEASATPSEPAQPDDKEPEAEEPQGLWSAAVALARRARLPS